MAEAFIVIENFQYEWWFYLIIGLIGTFLSFTVIIIALRKKELTVSQLMILSLNDLRTYALEKNVKNLTNIEPKELLIWKILNTHLRTKKIVKSFMILRSETVRKIAHFLRVPNIKKKDTKKQIIIKIIQYSQDIDIKINPKKLFHTKFPRIENIPIKNIYVLKKLSSEQLREIIKFNKFTKKATGFKITSSKDKTNNIINIIRNTNHYRYLQIKKLQKLKKEQLINFLKEETNKKRINNNWTIQDIIIEIMIYYELHKKYVLGLYKYKKGEI